MPAFKLSKTERAEIDKAVAAYDAALTALSELIDTYANDWDTFFDERSEKWQEGEKGQEAREKVDAMRAIFDELPTADDVTGIDFDQFA